MNNYEKFHRENESIISGLSISLDELLAKFEKGIIPGNPEKADAIYSINAYKEAIGRFCKADKDTFKKITNSKVSFDENNAYKELSQEKESFPLLMRLSLEKIIDVGDSCFQSKAGKTLLDGNYCDEIMFDGSEQHYYTLSSKAEKALKSKSLIEKMRKDYSNAVISNALIFDSGKWSGLYAKRVEMLRRYYNQNDVEYIIFTLDEAKELVFGCELNDSVETTYTFAAIFDESIYDDINQLKEIAGLGRIDRIVLVTDDNDIADKLKEEGINAKETPHLSVKLMTMGD